MKVPDVCPRCGREWEWMYGGFHGGDPRLFKPDPECSTDAERAAHAAVCKQWDEADIMPPEPDTHIRTEYVHITLSGYGLGGYAFCTCEWEP